jgi:hypothetical protein
LLVFCLYPFLVVGVVLLRVPRRTQADPSVPAEISSMMAAEESRMLDVLLSQGPWVDPQQLPKKYLPGLLASPFHDTSSSGDAVAAATEILQRWHPKLVAEYETLLENGEMLREQECTSPPPSKFQTKKTRTDKFVSKHALQLFASRPSPPFLAPRFLRTPFILFFTCVSWEGKVLL